MHIDYWRRYYLYWSGPLNPIYIIFLKILENEGNKKIGLKFDILFLSPFLYTGVMIEYFSLIGNTPVDKDYL
jgi:hypothetical protein